MKVIALKLKKSHSSVVHVDSFLYSQHPLLPSEKPWLTTNPSLFGGNLGSKLQFYYFNYVICVTTNKCSLVKKNSVVFFLLFMWMQAIIKSCNLLSSQRVLNVQGYLKYCKRQTCNLLPCQTWQVYYICPFPQEDYCVCAINLPEIKMLMSGEFLRKLKVAIRGSLLQTVVNKSILDDQDIFVIFHTRKRCFFSDLL